MGRVVRKTIRTLSISRRYFYILLNPQVKEALQRMGPLLPMNIFLRQEIDRMQKVLLEVHSTLSNLKLAIEGTIVMSRSLREALDAMYDARVPDAWKKVRSAALEPIFPAEIDAEFFPFLRCHGSQLLWVSGSRSYLRETYNSVIGTCTDDQMCSG